MVLVNSFGQSFIKYFKALILTQISNFVKSVTKEKCISLL